MAFGPGAVIRVYVSDVDLCETTIVVRESTMYISHALPGLVQPFSAGGGVLWEPLVHNATNRVSRVFLGVSGNRDNINNSASVSAVKTPPLFSAFSILAPLSCAVCGDNEYDALSDDIYLTLD